MDLPRNSAVLCVNTNLFNDYNMDKITIAKKGRDGETLRLMDLEEVVNDIRNGRYALEVEKLRDMIPLNVLKRIDDWMPLDERNVHFDLPRLCFAAQYENRNHQRQRRAYTGLVLLEVDNLTGTEEAEAVSRGASLMPQTLLSFVGATGHSVKIVCRGELIESGGKKVEGGLMTDDDINRFHRNLFEMARMVYNAQLGVTIEKMEPHLERTCFVSSDETAHYNPLCVPFYTDCSQRLGNAMGMSGRPEGVEPELDSALDLHRVYNFCLSKAYDDISGISHEDPQHPFLLATRLAARCCEAGLGMSACLHLALFHHHFWVRKELVRQIFENEYRDEAERKYKKRKNIVQPQKVIPPETLLTMKIDIFLRQNYELRLNVMRGVPEYRERLGMGLDYQDLTEEVRNTMTMRALEQGIKCWDKDIRRYVHSTDIRRYEPMTDFLEHLPRWDGKDRVRPLAMRVKSDYKEWPYLFHIWMRSMVAMWQGRGQLTGNALVPLLIGRQGCGKTSFCRILLPRDQREYYNDRINFKNETDLNLGLTSFALINLDEFDKITQRQQVVLKYLVSTSDLKYRPPYGKAYQQHRRYASFIGTTNETHPLTDPSGSRRFVCVTVNGDIDFQSPVEYGQLYAQLKQEIQEGERYWLTKDEEQALMEHNRLYRTIDGLGEMLLSLYRRPEGDEEGHWISLKEMSAQLKLKYKSGFKEEPGTLERMGRFLSRPEYKFLSRQRSYGVEYLVVERFP